LVRLDAVRDAMRGTASSKPSSIGTDDTQIGLEWLDPVIGQRTADELAKRLTLLRQPHQVYFESRAKQFNEQIDALLAEYTPKFKSAPRRRVMSLTHEFDYLAERFDVDVVHVIGTTPEKIGDAELTTLARASREEHLTTLLVRIDTPAGLIQDISKRSGLRLITIDPYGSSSANEHDSYIKLLRYNVDQLLDALGAGKP
jgi:zinc transport system substrate-binding protein